jgi:hypothetical protein
MDPLEELDRANEKRDYDESRALIRLIGVLTCILLVMTLVGIASL